MDGGALRVKDLPPVLTATSLIDVCLSKTQRKTPTEIHKKTNILVIRKFYIRKIKTASQFFNEKLKAIIDLFPKLDSIHPFYADILNILYDRDHYKLALGQVSTAIHRIDKIAKEYITLSKYSDSLYKSKSLKVAALGRYCTVIKKLAKVFLYLEQVRMHMQRLPQINTSIRTLLLAGFPNVGKSSFVNRISHANVDVQPFAFTTKSLFVGHFDYMYTRWQVIDTPGVLDHPLEDRNLIEMLAITALTHLHSAVLFVIDISEECGYPLADQINLYKSLEVLFKAKPKLIVLNKCDKCTVDELPENIKEQLKSIECDSNVSMVTTSTLTGAGVDDAKNKACELLLEQRLLQKAAAVAAVNPSAVAEATASSETPLAGIVAAASLGVNTLCAAKLHVTKVDNPRAPFIPDSVKRQQELKMMGKEIDIGPLEKDIEEEFGGPGVYSVDMKKNYILEDEDWKYDIVPELMNGRNVRDFFDPDIAERLEALEQEEEMMKDHEEKIRPEREVLLSKLRHVRSRLERLHRGIQRKRMESKLKSRRNGPRLVKKTNKQLAEARSKLIAEDRNDGISEGTSRKRGRSVERSTAHRREGSFRMDMDTNDTPRDRLSKKIRTLTRSRSVMDTNRVAPYNRVITSDTQRYADPRETSSVIMGKKRRLGGISGGKAHQFKKAVDRKLFGTAGESDRFIAVKKVKHMLSGKRSIGKTDRR